MSAGDDGGDDSGPGAREVAHRLFAAEFDDADLDHSESDEERAPNYVVTPTGLRVNRLFAVGVLTEVESVNEQTLRGRVVDPTGAFVTYAGQYQPDEAAFLDRTTPPAFVALTGKARTFQPEDSDLVYTSVRPESLATVDADTRDRWVVSAAEATLRRVAVFSRALELDARGDRLRGALESAGVPTALAAGIPLAIDHYDTGTRYLEAVRTLAVDALEVVADEREEVRALAADPGDRGGADLGPLPDVPYDLDAAAIPDEAAADDGSEATADAPADAVEAADATGVDPANAGDAGDAAEPAAADTDAAASTAATVDGPDAGAGDGDVDDEADPVDAAAEPAEAAGAEPDSADVAEADPGAGAEPEPAESASTEDLGGFDDGDGDDGPGEFDDGDDDLGDFDAGTDSDVPVTDATDDLGEFDAGEAAGDADVDPDADPEDFEDALTDEERREVEEEHGVEFSTGTEVPDAGESGIETPDPEPADDEPGDAGDVDGDDGGDPAASAVDAGASADEVSGGVDAGGDEPAADVDLEDAVVTVMDDLDDGDGADRGAVVAEAVDRYGADEGAVEDAIEDALMGGKCFEPTDGTLKAI
ncbi:RPA family protein [Halobaculum sp. EA56]|uniref:RPA family protein n=1 Tax=Halobaculum sp. EA56 TaxID=3421648 RepID=UPI003EBDF850